MESEERTNGKWSLVSLFEKILRCISIMQTLQKPFNHVWRRYDLNGKYFGCGIKKLLLVVPIQRGVNHNQVKEWFSSEGNLLLNRRKNNTINPMSGTSQLDERPGF